MSERPLRLALRHVVFGGEALDLRRIADWYAHLRRRWPRVGQRLRDRPRRRSCQRYSLGPAIAVGNRGRRSGVRFGTRVFMFWMIALSLYLLG